jgi:exodeoxyribonuclease VII large subunit
MPIIMGDGRFDFFDPGKSRAARLRGAEAPKASASGPMSVSALVARIKGALAEALPKRITVVGEISNFTLHSSGHMYFSLKDPGAAIDATMFRSDNRRLKFTPADGMEVVADGQVDVYEVRGQLQINVQRMTPRGQGALELAFRQLCEKLRAEGLFSPEAKKPIPRFPRAIGLVTSPTGAAIRDIRGTLHRRWPAARVLLVAALVQGAEAPQSVAQALNLLDANAEAYEIDTIIVARGGGSLEDLWAFNTEEVARAIFAAAVPVISGVGHEVDVTIADMVADVRAATPTAAAELAVPNEAEIRRRLATLVGRMARRASERAAAAAAALAGIGRSATFRDPTATVRTQAQRIDELSHRLRAAAQDQLAEARSRLHAPTNQLADQHPARLAQQAYTALQHLHHRMAWALGRRSKRSGDRLADLRGRLAARSPVHQLVLAGQKIDAAARQLEAMSYRAVLHRGFSVTRRAEGQILRSARQAKDGDRIRTELADGKISSIVGNTAPKAAPNKKQPPQAAPGLFE